MEKKSTILLVEDNPIDEVLIRSVFEKDDDVMPHLVVARDGVQALDYLFGNGPYAQGMAKLPNAVIMDIRLPRIHGLEVLLQMRANQKTELLPVIMLSASNQTEDMIDSYKFGANAYIRKPHDVTKFAEIIKSLALFWGVVNQPVIE